MKNHERELRFLSAVLAILILHSGAIAETVYVDARRGRDQNPGTKEEPVRTIERAAEMVSGGAKPAPTTIRLTPGIYDLTRSVEFDSARSYTEKRRFVIEAAILPDDPKWKPAMMPVILSTEDPRKQGGANRLTATHGLRIKISHVTIRGLKFLGNPLARNWHNCISRTGDGLKDLVVTQCLFVGDKDVIDIYSAVLATGDGFVVDHCIFRNCHACAVFWDGPQGVSGRGCSMRYCIVDGAYIAGVWTCQTAEDFEFHHNIVTRSDYFWMRREIDNPRRYGIHDCIVADNRNYSGYGVETGPTGLTGPEVIYEEENIVKQVSLVIEKDKRERNYLHVVAGTPGSSLEAGLFTK